MNQKWKKEIHWNILYSAVWKARVKFFSLSFGTNELKSKASGKNRWTRAQKAIPSHQDDEKFSMLTPWKAKRQKDVSGERQREASRCAFAALFSLTL